MKDIEAKVKKILEGSKRSRGDDDYLYAEFLRRFCKIDLAEINAKEFLLTYRKEGIPTVECIGRCRRKIQSESPSLLPSEKDRIARRRITGKFYEYFSEKC